MLPEYVYWIYRKCNGPMRARDERRETCRLSIHTEVPNMSSRLTMVGFALVLWKIARGRGFVWLVRRHLWTLAAAVYRSRPNPMASR